MHAILLLACVCDADTLGKGEERENDGEGSEGEGKKERGEGAAQTPATGATCPLGYVSGGALAPLQCRKRRECIRSL